MTEKSDLIIPRVHLNGSDKGNLLHGYLNAYARIDEALTALSQTWPHARDYYVQGKPAERISMAQHESRMQRLRDVKRELGWIIEGIDAQSSRERTEPAKPATTVIPIGDAVLCDFCNVDYTESAESGGFILAGNAVCPKCAPNVMRDARVADELHVITHRCPADKSFGDFIRAYRGPDAAITITAGGRPR